MTRVRTLTALLALSGAAVAQDWYSPDGIASGLGRAGTASTEGMLNSFWNPANLAKGRDSIQLFGGGFGVGATFSTEFVIVGDVVSQMNAIGATFSAMATLQPALNAGTATAANIESAIRAVDAVTRLGQDMGVIADAGGSLEIRLGTFGVFYRGTGHAAADPYFNLTTFSALADGGFVDVFAQPGTTGTPATPEGMALSLLLQGVGLSLGDADSFALRSEFALGSAALTNPTTIQALLAVAATTNVGALPTETLLFNESGVRFRGALIREAGVSMGVPVLPFLTVGGAVKHVRVETYVFQVSIRDIQTGTILVEEALDYFKESRRVENTANFDLSTGVTIGPLISLGLTARNVVPMKFRYADGVAFSIDPQVRFGGSAGLGPFKASMDLDLTENFSDALKGYRSRLLGGGLKFEPSLGGVGLSVSVGGFGNLLDSNATPVWSTALGLNIGPLFVNFSAQAAFSKVTLDEPINIAGFTFRNLPERFGVAGAIGFDLWF
jgi:hypothetical protein